MPWLDWQFYVVTAAAAWGTWMLLRQLLPRYGDARPACGTGAAARAKKPPAASGGRCSRSSRRWAMTGS